MSQVKKPLDISESNDTSNSPAASRQTLDPCRICRKTLLKKDKSIYCDFCQCWFHQACCKLDDDTFDALSKSDQMFFCPLCLPAAKRFILLERRVDDHEQRLSSIEERLAKLEAPPNPPAPLPLMTLHPPNSFMQLLNALPDKDQIRDEVEGTVSERTV